MKNYKVNSSVTSKRNKASIPEPFMGPFLLTASQPLEMTTTMTSVIIIFFVFLFTFTTFVSFNNIV